MYTDLIYCMVRISNTQAYIRSAVTHLTDAADDFSEKTTETRTVLLSIYSIYLLNLGKYGFETNGAGYSSAFKLGPLANICD